MEFDKLVPKERVRDFLDAVQVLHNVDGQLHRRSSDEVEKNRQAVDKVVTAHFRRPAKKSRATLKAAVASTDIPGTITEQASVFTNVDYYDMGWELAYLDATIDEGRDFWEILDMNQGITFRKVPEGGRVRTEEISGERTMVFLDAFGGGISWTDQMVRFRKIAAMEQIAQAMRDGFWNRKAEEHYSLIGAAISGSNTTSYNTTPTGELEQDIATINDGAFALSNRLRNAYVGNPLQQEMILYFNPNVWSRVMRALRQTGQDVPGQPNRILYNIRPVPTFSQFLTDASGNSVNTDMALVLPGFKNQKGDLGEPESHFQFDPSTNSFDQYVWAYYGAAVESDQIQKVEMA